MDVQSVDSILEERGKKYGAFKDHAIIAQTLKYFIQEGLKDRQKILKSFQLEALDMICHKIGRIVNGDSDYVDSWLDIAGYAKLAADILVNKDIK